MAFLMYWRKNVRVGCIYESTFFGIKLNFGMSFYSATKQTFFMKPPYAPLNYPKIPDYYDSFSNITVGLLSAPLVWHYDDVSTYTSFLWLSAQFNFTHPTRRVKPACKMTTLKGVQLATLRHSLSFSLTLSFSLSLSPLFFTACCVPTGQLRRHRSNE